MSHVAPEITVVVCTYNRAAVLGECLDSLLAQELAGERYEVVVVDDGSEDDTRRVAETRTGGRTAVRVVRQDNAGLNAARNRGVAAARSAWVSFLDDDELAPPGHLAAVAAHLARDPGLDGVGGPYREWEGGDDEAALPTCAECSLAAHAMAFDEPTLVEHLFGGNMTLRRSAFDEVGPFDAGVSRQGSARGDEGEWFHRAAGRLRLLYDPDLWIWHRRDLFGLRSLLRHAFMQGRTVPEIARKRGGRYRPRPLRLVRGLGHAARRRCTQGLVVAAREAGSWMGALGGLVRRGRAA